MGSGARNLGTASKFSFDGRATRKAAIWLTAGAVAVTFISLPEIAIAQNATWSTAPGTSDYNTAANWTPATVPTGTAFFGATTTPGVTFSGDSAVDGWTFNAGAAAYTFTLTGHHLQFNGAGIDIIGGSATIANAGLIDFNNSSTAGGASITTNAGGFLNFNATSNAGTATLTINNGGEVDFRNSSSAANANITNNSGGLLFFNDTSTAGSATITNVGGGGDQVAFKNSSTAGNATIINTGLVNFNDTSSAGSANITNNAAAFVNFNGTSTAGTSTIAINNGGEVDFRNSSTAGNAAITNNSGGLLFFNDTSTAGSATITNVGGGGDQVAFKNSSTAGNATIINTGLVNFNDTSSAGSANITNNAAAFMNFNGTSTAGTSTIAINNGGQVDFYNSSTAGSANIAVNSGGLLNFNNSSTAGAATVTTNAGGLTSILATASGGTARFIINGTGILDISQITSASTTAGSIEGSGRVRLGSKTLVVGGDNLSTTFTGVLQDGGTGGGTGGSLTKSGTGTLTLAGTNTYTGPTVVDAGTLLVDGSIASSSFLTINSGGSAGGTGTLPTTIVATGGTLVAGGNSVGTLTVNGNLTFNSGSTYAIHLTPSNSSRTNVSGTASLAGNVNAIFQSGSYLSRSYTILSATGGLGGTTFNSVTSSNPNLHTTLSYTANDVLLNLTAALAANQSLLSTNQQNVSNAINGYFNAGNSLPANFASLYNLTGDNLATALSQLSGEPAAELQVGAFQMMNDFLGLLTDAPGGDLDEYGTAANVSESTPVSAFASTRTPALPPAIANAYAAILPKHSKMSRSTGWSVWATPFGGYYTAEGNASTGSHQIDARNYGGAAGLNYRLSPEAIIGFALAGGGTNWGLHDGLGGGSSDDFLAGVYGEQLFGRAYVKGALSFGGHWASTDRYALGDHLTANLDAYALGGRAEGGYRLGTISGVSITPYAALQVESLHIPGYNETDVTGGGFGLSYGSRTATETRSKLGARISRRFVLDNSKILEMRFGAAWAHSWYTDPSVTASFQALPGASFIVNGATPSRDSALLSAGAKLYLADGVSLGARFAGEFGQHSQTYTGFGVLSYHW